MNKRVLTYILLGGLVFMTGCGTKKSTPSPTPDGDGSKDNQPCSYESIYDGLSKERHDIVYKLTDFKKGI